MSFEELTLFFSVSDPYSQVQMNLLEPDLDPSPLPTHISIGEASVMYLTNSLGNNVLIRAVSR